MSQPYVGEIRMFGGNFAPRGWRLCNGQLLSIAQNDALYTLLGTTYGGDGVTTFGLPNLQGRIPLHAGQQPGGATYVLGEMAGVESVTLTTNQMPQHSHPVLAQSQPGDQASPTGNVGAQSSLNEFSSSPGTVSMASNALSGAGGSQPHDNMQPFLAVNFIISLEGIFPSQS